MKRYVYLDYAAATPLDPRVYEVMRPYLIERFANPSSLHTPGREQRAALAQARKQIARVLGAKPAEIVFTSGSTEAAAISIGGVARAVPSGRLIGSPIEHEAVLESITGYDTTGARAGSIVVGSDGLVTPERVVAAVNDLTTLVCVQYVNNEIGTVQPIAKISAAIARIRADRTQRGIVTPLYLYCDAAQAGLLSLQVSRLGVDLLSMGGSKLYGPPGSGFLYVRTGVRLEPVLFGGGQESGLRSGTEAVALTAGLAAALENLQQDRTTESKRQAELRDWLWAQLQQRIPSVRLNGGRRQRLAGNLNLLLPGADGETLVAYLDQAGFGVATGSACSTASQAPSHVLLAIGLSSEQAASSLRVTLGRQTSKSDLQRFVVSLAASYARVVTLPRLPQSPIQ